MTLQILYSVSFHITDLQLISLNIVIFNKERNSRITNVHMYKQVLFHGSPNWKILFCFKYILDSIQTLWFYLQSILTLDHFILVLLRSIPPIFEIEIELDMTWESPWVGLDPKLDNIKKYIFRWWLYVTCHTSLFNLSLPPFKYLFRYSNIFLDIEISSYVSKYLFQCKSL